MSKETLSAKNFGPIREAELDLRKVTVLIGEQASGKSVLAKLVAICKDERFSLIPPKSKESEISILDDRLEHFGLLGFEHNESHVQFTSDDFNLVWDKQNVEIEFLNKNLELGTEKVFELEKAIIENEAQEGRFFKSDDFNSLEKAKTQLELNQRRLVEWKNKNKRILGEIEYIPAERVVASLIELSDEENNFLDAFGEKFQARRRMSDAFQILIPNIKYRFDPKEHQQQIQMNGHAEIDFSNAATGIQSLVPLQVLIETVNPIIKTLFIIEEPELNLYPSTQKKLVEYLVEKCTKGENRLIITTHSPYILTALNNCIQAKNALRENPGAAPEVNKLVRPESQIDFEDVMAYFVHDGTADPIMNRENRLIDANALDSISDDMAETFDKLLSLELQH